MIIYFEHPETGLKEHVKCGYSWTVLLFGFMPEILRGRIAPAIILFLTAYVTLWLTPIIYAFFRNKAVARKLLLEGYRVSHCENKTKASIWLGINRNRL